MRNDGERRDAESRLLQTGHSNFSIYDVNGDGVHDGCSFSIDNCCIARSVQPIQTGSGGASFFCHPVQRSVMPPLQPATPILSALNKLKININLR